MANRPTRRAAWCAWPALALLFLLPAAGCKRRPARPAPQPAPAAAAPSAIRDHALLDTVRQRLEQLPPITLNVATGDLPAAEQQALSFIVRAARVMDTLFLKQAYSGNEQIRIALKGLIRREPKVYMPLYAYFQANAGPFARLHGNAPFINVCRSKPAGAAFYPDDMTRDEFAAHLQEHPADAPAFTSPYTVIRRRAGRLVAIPYSDAYRDDLPRAATLLEQAAGLTAHPPLRAFLNSRARAFRDNDYGPSDADWLSLGEHDIDVVIGPAEVYEDRLLATKAAFGAIVARVDREESRRLERIAARLPEIASRLPGGPALRPAGAPPPRVVVADEVFCAGDARAGAQVIACDLPNDVTVRRRLGSRQLMLRNVITAKFRTIQMPVARRLLAPDLFRRVSFAASFQHTLLRELARSLEPASSGGPPAGRDLRELYPLIEEARADTLGLWLQLQLHQLNAFPPALPAEDLYATYLAGLLRSMRFGRFDPHGEAGVLQFNYLRAQGALAIDPAAARAHLDSRRMAGALDELAAELSAIVADADRERAARLVAAHGRMDADAVALLARLGNVPVDFRPEFAGGGE